MFQAAALAIALQVAAPIAILIWLWRRQPAGRVDWFINALAGLSIVIAVTLIAPWMMVPWQASYFYVAAAFAAAARSSRLRQPAQSGSQLRRVSRLIVAGLFAIVGCGLSGLAVAARYPPRAQVLDVACPFESGLYLVVSGGSKLLVNAHMTTLEPAPRFAPWRGQSYGVDLVKLDDFGRRASGFVSADPSDYFIHGQPVTAPCAGTVVSIANDRPDMAVASRDPDRSKLAGNHVLISCSGAELLIAPLLRDSVRVGIGSHVKAGDPLGLVGNSGNTDEPHLHLSAQRRSEGQALIGGDPVWLRIDGRFLVRNDRLFCGAL